MRRIFACVVLAVGIVFLPSAVMPVKCSGCETTFTPTYTGYASMQAGNATAFNNAYNQLGWCSDYCEYNCPGSTGDQSSPWVSGQTQRWVDVNSNGIPEDDDYWVVEVGGGCDCYPKHGQPIAAGRRIELTTTQKVLKFFGLTPKPKAVPKRIGG